MIWLLFLLQSTKISTHPLHLWSSSLRMTAKQRGQPFLTTSIWTPWASAWATAACKYVFLNMQTWVLRTPTAPPSQSVIYKRTSASFMMLLQVTFQACSIDEARYLYDQLATFCPIVVSGCMKFVLPIRNYSAVIKRSIQILVYV